ncbi:MAG: DUF1846 domain-containing protein [Firmicutes bacterium]|nr:DUF1846 domain-containing protein [Bacillota bacterium]
MKIGFDNDLYVNIQSKKIRERFKLFDKLYLEIGGKLFEDNHATRVLPGFEPDAKINMFLELKNDLEIIFCINAGDIEKNKTRAEYGITYDTEILRLIENSKARGFSVNSVVITLYNNQVSVDKFIKKLERHNIKTYIHRFTKGYPTDIETIVSDEGYGANPYIQTTKPLVLVNAPGPGSGKLATCLSQLYHEHQKGINAGYAKFETFPVWDLPLKHPVNLAYEAATADLKDVNMIDPYHLEHYGKMAVNYNRDVETFPILKAILNKITGKDIYYSPTDMGVNMLAQAITNHKIIENAAKKEIVRRYYQERCNYKLGNGSAEAIQKIKLLMNELKIDTSLLDTVSPALEKSQKVHRHVVSLKLPNGKIVTGKETELLSPASSMLLNAIKEITKIPDEIDLLSESVLKPIIKLKENSLSDFNKTLQLQEVLIALSICAVTNPIIQKALNNIQKLKNCDAHSTYIISNGDLKTLKSLKINLTCEPVFFNDSIY